MFNLIEWIKVHDKMVQFHPADIGPSVVVLMSDKALHSAETTIMVGDMERLHDILDALEAVLEDKAKRQDEMIREHGGIVLKEEEMEWKSK